MKRRLVVAVMSAVMLCTSLTGCSIGNMEFVLDVNDVGKNHVFAINGSKCTKEEARLYLCNYQNIYGNEYGVDLWQHDFGEMAPEDTLETYVKDVTLSELANVMCMSLLAESQEITLTEEEEKLVSKATNEYYESLSKEEISYMGIDKGELLEFYKKYAMAQKLYNDLTQGVNEEVSDDEARVIRVQQIYVKDAEDAKAVQRKLAGGDDFASVASNYNEADAIEITTGRGKYPAEVDKVAFGLDNGEQSNMITSEDGYYFIKCLSKYEEALTEGNKENIIVQRRKEQFDDVLREFIENSEFELNDEVWDNIKVDASGAIKTDSFFEIYDKYFTE